MLNILLAAVLVLLACIVPSVGAQSLLENSAEARFQLDVHIPDAVLAALLPGGWTCSVATQGAAKDANLRVVFIDRMTINGPDGKPLGKGSNRLAYLVAPVKDSSGTAAQMVIGGITADPTDAPGPFGVYLPATIHTMLRTVRDEGGQLVESQDWDFAAATGEHLQMHIKFEKGIGNKSNPTDTKFYSAKNPAQYQISRQEQVLNILRNATTNPPDLVKEFSFKASGGSYAKLFDGSEKLLSWDNIVWINRAVSVP
jgi:hypothetical protein